jgi:lycopene cyclase domain-containing protein
MSEYLLINILIIIVPLLLTFEQNLKFYKKLRPVLTSILIASPVYIIWDSIATIHGDWDFNPKYLLGIHFFNLPLEEILFFVTVPYSIIFIFETVNYYLKERKIFFNRYLYFTIILLLLVGIVVFRDQNYTLIVFIYCIIFFAISSFFFRDIIKSKVFWITILISYIPFLIINYVLTSLPIVTYNPNAIWGNRLLTIPLEDFFYSFSMISFWLLAYLIVNKKIKWQSQ